MAYQARGTRVRVRVVKGIGLSMSGSFGRSVVSQVRRSILGAMFAWIRNQLVGLTSCVAMTWTVIGSWLTRSELGLAPVRPWVTVVGQFVNGSALDRACGESALVRGPHGTLGWSAKRGSHLAHRKLGLLSIGGPWA